MASTPASIAELSLHSVVCRAVILFVVFVAILGLVTVDVTLATGDERRELPGRREKRNANTNYEPGWAPSSDQLFSILEQYETDQPNPDLLLYTPTTPSPEDVNCHVEIPVTRRVGGKCVNLGSFVGCQAGIYLAFDSMCTGQLGVSVGEGMSSEAATAAQTVNVNRPRRRHRNPFQRRGRLNSLRLRSRTSRLPRQSTTQ